MGRGEKAIIELRTNRDMDALKLWGEFEELTIRAGRGYRPVLRAWSTKPDEKTTVLMLTATRSISLVGLHFVKRGNGHFLWVTAPRTEVRECTFQSAAPYMPESAVCANDPGGKAVAV